MVHHAAKTRRTLPTSSVAKHLYSRTRRPPDWRLCERAFDVMLVATNVRCTFDGDRSPQIISRPVGPIPTIGTPVQRHLLSVSYPNGRHNLSTREGFSFLSLNFNGRARLLVTECDLLLRSEER